jgi:hypothetical protein
MRTLFFLWFLFFIRSVSAAAEINLYQFDQQRPLDGIYDPGEWIRGPAKTNLTRELNSIRESSGIDVLVAVVDKLGENDPQAIADELANRWGYHGGRALVLCVPDHPDSPWISISGLIRSEIPRPTLEAIIDKAKQRARTDQTAHGAARRAVDSLGEDLRYASARALRTVQAPVGPVGRPSIKDLFFLLLRSIKTILIVVAVFSTIGFLIIYSAIKIWKKARMTLTPKIFPDVSWKPRFGAPHAGISYTYSVKKKAPLRSHEP